MTRAEKFEEVFGKEIDLTAIWECLFEDGCAECPNLENGIESSCECCKNWWQSEYEERRKND